MFANIIPYAYDFNIIVNGALVRELEGTACAFRCCGRCTTFCITQSSTDSYSTRTVVRVPGVIIYQAEVPGSKLTQAGTVYIYAYRQCKLAIRYE